MRPAERARASSRALLKTMTLALPKTGLLPSKTGTVLLADIGIPEAVYRQMGLDFTSPFDERFRIPLERA